MNTYIYMNDLENNSEIRSFINHKVKTTLKRFNYLIKKIEIRITDENGPKGGDDKNCMVYIKTDLFPEIVINGVKPDAYASVSDAVLRAKRTLARRVKQTRSYARTPMKAAIIFE
ncbi:MAG: HPF/RaiA family ribosome-associated protein [Marinicellaceae bacterium]